VKNEKRQSWIHEDVESVGVQRYRRAKRSRLRIAIMVYMRTHVFASLEDGGLDRERERDK